MLAASLLVIVGTIACDRIRPEDRAYFEQLEKERAERESVLRRASETVDDSEVIDRVKQHRTESGESTEGWLQQQIAAMKGQMMFPRWETSRRGSNKQEVRFSFVFIDTQNRMQRLAYTWQVDVLDMSVGSPQLSKLSEVTSMDATRNQQVQRRIREHERQLE